LVRNAPWFADEPQRYLVKPWRGRFACEEMITADERATGHVYKTVARVRLDLAWETALVPEHLNHNTVYIPAMNQKAGACDKFAFGRREP